jgi:hypothetical protein
MLKKAWPSISNLILWLSGVVVGALITHFIEGYLNRSKEEADLAQYYVASMPSQCRPRTSLELDDQVKRFIAATRRARAHGDGIPVWREDCSIGAHFSITLKEGTGIKEKLIDKLAPKQQ